MTGLTIESIHMPVELRNDVVAWARREVFAFKLHTDLDSSNRRACYRVTADTVVLEAASPVIPSSIQIKRQK